MVFAWGSGVWMLGSIGTRSSSEGEDIGAIGAVCMAGMMDNSVGATGC